LTAAAIGDEKFVPGFKRTAILGCCLMTTIMQTLDTTIANVALPYMQGSLSASLDQINWVLTSYIVAAAIMTAPVGWLAHRFGRKRLYLVCIAGFTGASMLCASAQNLDQIVVYRVLQGICGAAMVPLGQSMMVELYALHERAKAQSLWGMGMMLGPIMGPTLGAYLTDVASWPWVFLINVPVGILAFAGLFLLMKDYPPDDKLKFDWFGFVALACGVGGLQLAFDRGEHLGWFDSTEIVAEVTIGIIGLYYFFAHSFTTATPMVRFDIFRDRNFATACFFMTLHGALMLATLALASPFVQHVMGQPIMSAGELLATRGIGTFLAMMGVRFLLPYIEARVLITAGYLLLAFTLYEMSTFTNETGALAFAVNGTVQGFAFGAVMISISTIAFLTVSDELRTYATSFFMLMRNLGGSFGISILIAYLTDETRATQARLTEFITPFNQALQMPDSRKMFDITTDTGRALIDQMLNAQAQVIAYSGTFVLLALMALAALPAILVVPKTREIMFRRRIPRADSVEA
jgi:MFS transporter, DHA2 family, multidrug resistance protein